jgi:hypothetical protein
VHSASLLRSTLPSPVAAVSAFSALNQEHLPPVDAVAAIVRLKDNTIGTYVANFGTETRPSTQRPLLTVLGQEGLFELTLSTGENGKRTWKIVLSYVGEEVQESTLEDRGIECELHAYAGALSARKGSEAWKTALDLGGPRQALLDLAFVEAVLKSGEHEGQPVTLGD